jgi:hypothetical protein
MSRIGEWIAKLKDLARGHPQQADEMLRRAERFANERTGNKYGEQIAKGRDVLRRQYEEEQRPESEQRPAQEAPGTPPTRRD